MNDKKIVSKKKSDYFFTEVYIYKSRPVINVQVLNMLM